jgi:hypothetical protein
MCRHPTWVGGEFESMVSAKWELDVGEHARVNALEEWLIFVGQEVDGGVAVDKGLELGEHLLEKNLYFGPRRIKLTARMSTFQANSFNLCSVGGSSEKLNVRSSRLQIEDNSICWEMRF